MKVYALVGKSGTGKSYQATKLCKRLGIESIIDDGLFIMGNVMAGTSAKRQGTKIGAVKTALFTKEEHKETVCDAILNANPKNILLIGTSDAMVERIAARLELPAISDTIYIEDITSEEEREIAAEERNEHGKHVIPVPSFKLKRQFSGYFVDPLRIFRSHEKENEGEKTVVRPTYSYLGEYIISEKVMADICEIVAKDIDGITQISRISAEKYETGIVINLAIFVKYKTKIMDVARKLQAEIEKEVENMTAFNVERVNIEIRGFKK